MPIGVPHRCRNLRRRAVHCGQAIGGYWRANSCIRVPYFGAALQCLPGTELVLTLTSGMSSVVKRDRRLRLVTAPPDLHAFHFLMAWHPRHNTDPRHVWLREAMRSSTAGLGG